MIETITVYGVKIFAVLVILVALIVLLLRDKKGGASISKADTVKNKLDRLGGEYTVLDNVMVRSGRGISCVPYVVVSPHGVFVVNACDLTGKVSGDQNAAEWHVKCGLTRDTILNPLWENRKHINTLEKNIGSYPFIPLVVFPYAKLMGDFGSYVVRTRQLQHFFAGYTKVVLKPEDRETIIRALKE